MRCIPQAKTCRCLDQFICQTEVATCYIDIVYLTVVRSTTSNFVRDALEVRFSPPARLSPHLSDKGQFASMGIFLKDISVENKIHGFYDTILPRKKKNRADTYIYIV